MKGLLAAALALLVIASAILLMRSAPTGADAPALGVSEASSVAQRLDGTEPLSGPLALAPEVDRDLEEVENRRTLQRLVAVP